MTTPINIIANGIFSDIGNGVSSIMDFFGNLGDSCVKILNGGMGAFSKLVYSAINILTADPESEVFADFWEVINRVSRILGVIATTVMVLLFIINIATDTWDSRHDFEIWGFAKMVAKMIVAIVIVNNSILIVVSIFKIGAILAGGIFNGSSGETVIELNDDYSRMLRSGVSGFEGFLMLVVFCIVALVIIGCAITICVEIYQRVFKMYILIPFSTISFTTVVMGDNNRGNEVFHGYFKTILSTAAEAVIIMLCIAFTHSLVDKTDTMNNLFPAIQEDEYETLECKKEGDACFLALYARDRKTAQHYLIELENASDYLSDEVIEFINDRSFSSSGRNEIGYGSIFIGDTNALDEDFLYFEGYSGFAYIYPKVTWFNVFMMLLQVAFPCILCAGAVKTVSNYSGMILGR